MADRRGSQCHVVVDSKLAVCVMLGLALWMGSSWGHFEANFAPIQRFQPLFRGFEPIISLFEPETAVFERLLLILYRC